MTPGDSPFAVPHTPLLTLANRSQDSPPPPPYPPRSPPTKSPAASAAFAGSAQSPANTAFAARAAITVAAVWWRRRCGRGGPFSPRRPHAPPGRLPRPPHARLLDYPTRFPPPPAMALHPPTSSPVTLGISFGAYPWCWARGREWGSGRGGSD